MTLNTPGATILLGSVFAPPDDQVTRLLVTRGWPKGVARGAVDQWEPQLAPAPDLLDALAVGAMSPEAFAEAYHAHLFARPSLLDWAARMATNNGVVLLCDSRDDPHDDATCHRGVLEAALRERIG